jgi:hypothetical protein
MRPPTLLLRPYMDLILATVAVEFIAELLQLFAGYRAFAR